MSHTHTPRLVVDLVLSLPTLDEHKWEKYVRFLCPCGQWWDFVGEFVPGVPHTLAQLLQRVDDERSDTSLQAQLARRRGVRRRMRATLSR